MSEKVILELKGICKTFNRGSVNEKVALRDFNLSVNEGDFITVIGGNGAGKSTLLKVIAGIYKPSGGKLTVEGNVSNMFELSTGFEVEQNGWDNMYLRGLMLGLSPKEIKSKMREIADFSELGFYADA